MKNKFEIKVNNNQTIKLYFDKNKDCLIKELYNSKNEPEYRQAISSEDIVSLLNWYNNQKENNNKDLMF
jgi:hypothetical protein